jgi:hypothetical protein
MTIAALNWPEAAVYIAAIIAAGLVASVLVWSVFRTGQVAIRNESRRPERVDDRRAAS